jgi:nucleotide-binding universal stress UspA family protein
LLAVIPIGQDRDEAAVYLSRLGDLVPRPDTTTRTVTNADPIETILDEAAYGYDLLMLGTPSLSSTDGAVFGPTIDDLVKLAPCPTLVVRADENSPATPPRHILVPIDGTDSSRRALELAFVIAGADSAVTAVHVMTPTLSGTRMGFAEDITAELVISATRLDQEVTPTIVEAANIESGIAAALEATAADLLILGTSVRAGTRRLYLGPRVERIAAEARCPVLISMHEGCSTRPTNWSLGVSKMPARFRGVPRGLTFHDRAVKTVGANGPSRDQQARRELWSTGHRRK